jgi:hypothetical protein
MHISDLSGFVFCEGERYHLNSADFKERNYNLMVRMGEVTLFGNVAGWCGSSSRVLRNEPWPRA